MNLTFTRFQRNRRPMLAAGAAFLALAAVAAGCGGGGVPPNGVAVVGDEVISKKEFEHWLDAAAKGQAQQTGATTQAAVPDPPDFEKCVAAKKKTPLPKGTPKPKDSDLKKQCKQEYDALKSSVMQFLISAEWIQE